jgi:hypothetical protein
MYHAGDESLKIKEDQKYHRALWTWLIQFVKSYFEYMRIYEQ